MRGFFFLIIISIFLAVHAEETRYPHCREVLGGEDPELISVECGIVTGDGTFYQKSDTLSLREKAGVVLRKEADARACHTKFGIVSQPDGLRKYGFKTKKEESGQEKVTTETPTTKRELLLRDLIEVAQGNDPICFDINLDQVERSRNPELDEIAEKIENILESIGDEFQPEDEVCHVDVDLTGIPQEPIYRDPESILELPPLDIPPPRLVSDDLLETIIETTDKKRKSPDEPEPEKLEICFAIDTSGSMNDDIEELHRKFSELENFWKKQYPQGVRVVIVEFSQNDDSPFSHKPLVYEGQPYQGLEKYLENFQVSGGIEPVFDAVHSCSKSIKSSEELNPELTKRVTIVLSDEPGDMIQETPTLEIVTDGVITKDIQLIIYDTGLKGCPSFVDTKLTPEEIAYQIVLLYQTDPNLYHRCRINFEEQLKKWTPREKHQLAFDFIESISSKQSEWPPSITGYDSSYEASQVPIFASEAFIVYRPSPPIGRISIEELDNGYLRLSYDDQYLSAYASQIPIYTSRASSLPGYLPNLETVTRNAKGAVSSVEYIPKGGISSFVSSSSDGSLKFKNIDQETVDLNTDLARLLVKTLDHPSKEIRTKYYSLLEKMGVPQNIETILDLVKLLNGYAAEEATRLLETVDMSNFSSKDRERLLKTIVEKINDSKGGYWPVRLLITHKIVDPSIQKAIEDQIDLRIRFSNEPISSDSLLYQTLRQQGDSKALEEAMLKGADSSNEFWKNAAFAYLSQNQISDEQVREKVSLKLEARLQALMKDRSSDERESSSVYYALQKQSPEKFLNLMINAIASDNQFWVHAGLYELSRSDITDDQTKRLVATQALQLFHNPRSTDRLKLHAAGLISRYGGKSDEVQLELLSTFAQKSPEVREGVKLYFSENRPSSAEIEKQFLELFNQSQTRDDARDLLIVTQPPSEELSKMIAQQVRSESTPEDLAVATIELAEELDMNDSHIQSGMLDALKVGNRNVTERVWKYFSETPLANQKIERKMAEMIGTPETSSEATRIAQTVKPGSKAFSNAMNEILNDSTLEEPILLNAITLVGDLELETHSNRKALLDVVSRYGSDLDRIIPESIEADILEAAIDALESTAKGNVRSEKAVSRLKKAYEERNSRKLKTEIRRVKIHIKNR